MSLVAKLPDASGALGSRPARRLIGSRRPLEVVLDFAALVGACVSIGVVAGLAMMLAVLLLA